MTASSIPRATRSSKSGKAGKGAMNAAAATVLAPVLEQNTPELALAAQKTRAVIALFTRPSAATQAELYMTRSLNVSAPVFGGYIGGVKVAAFLRQVDGKKPFLSFVTPTNEQVGTGNVVVRSDGVPVIKAIMSDKREVWISISKNVNDVMLRHLGANMSRLHIKTVKITKETDSA